MVLAAELGHVKGVEARQVAGRRPHGGGGDELDERASCLYKF